MIRFTKQEGNKVWMKSQLGWGYENGITDFFAGDDPEWDGPVKYVYLTVYSDYMNGEFCGQECYYRITKSSRKYYGTNRIQSKHELLYTSPVKKANEKDIRMFK